MQDYIGLIFRYNIHHYVLGDNNIQERNYVLVDCNKIEINFDANYIYVETEYVETVCSNLFNCEVPVIPNNGLLIEAIAYYCIYKMLCRGYKHPVFNLNASQYGTNPYYIWNQLKEEAKRSVLNNNADDSSKLFRSNLFIEAFDPRNQLFLALYLIQYVGMMISIIMNNVGLYRADFQI